MGSRKGTGLSDQALLIHCSTKNVPTVQHVSSITAFCIRIHRPGQSCNSFKLAHNLFEIIPIMDSTSGTVLVIFTCHVLISSYFKSYTSGASW